MPLPVPNLDDRNYAQLVEEAKALIPSHSPEWTDLSPGDIGTTLVELFAYLTDAMLYRLNRIPDKAFVQFLNLVGVTLTPPAAASVELSFSIKKVLENPVAIPRGTRVTTARQAPIFTTVMDATIPAGGLSASVVALNCQLVPAELLGSGNGQGGQRFQVSRPPIVLDSGDGSDLLVGVEVRPDELDQRVSMIRHDGISYRLWREVSHFGVDMEDPHVFLADRAEGVITFAPAVRNVSGPNAALLGAAPAVGRQVRAWYRSSGDGAGGNVNANTLTVIKDPIPGVEVINGAPATGGRDMEKLDNALLRGPHQVKAYERVITARDYERAAVRSSGGVSRALALTRASLWAGAPAGEVEVLLLPSVDDDVALTATAADLKQRQSDLVVSRVRDALAEQQPLGTTTKVGWAGLKDFHVEVKNIVVYRAEDRVAVTQRLHDRLRRALTPLPVGGTGWPFGEPLRASTVYDVLLAERGVRYVDGVRLVVDQVPGDVLALLADPHQEKTWFCASEGRVFRSTSDADGWELVQIFDGEQVESMAVCPGMPGLLIACARVGKTESSRVHLSRDFGESWSSPAEFSFHVEDCTLGAVAGRAAAFFATDNGLFRLDLIPGAVPESILVEAAAPAKPFYAVEVVSDTGDELQVAVAAQELGGVFLSFQGGRPGTYQKLGLQGVDVRLLRTQRTPGRRFLLTGAFATGDEPGAGVSRIELYPTQAAPGGFRTAGTSWVGGSCRDLAPVGDRVFAATAKAAVSIGDTSREDAPWRPSAVDCGLPLREVGRFQPLLAVAAAGKLLLAGCIGGVYASSDGRNWEHASPREFSERISLPRTWLFAPGEHQLTVRYEDVGERNAG
jgi:baseplate J-like protein